jgi:hypothetical protein
MATKSSKLVISIESEFVSIDATKFKRPPELDLFQTALGASARRDYRKGSAYLPTAIFDDLGLVARYHPDTELVALVDIHLATAGRRAEPASPFHGTVVLNGQALRRPLLLKDMRRSGDFRFGTGLVGSAGGVRIDVSIAPKFEYVGIINFGWKVEQASGPPVLGE